MVICLEQDADLHMAQLMPLPLTVSCFNKIQISFTFLVLAHLGSPGKKAIKQVCVQGLCPSDPLTRGSVPGPRRGLCPRPPPFRRNRCHCLRGHKRSQNSGIFSPPSPILPTPLWTSSSHGHTSTQCPRHQNLQPVHISAFF